MDRDRPDAEPGSTTARPDRGGLVHIKTVTDEALAKIAQRVKWRGWIGEARGATVRRTPRKSDSG
jgi:hypothetical protein